MIGVDTNVLARLFLEDDAEQTAIAQRFFAERTSQDPAFISAVVIAEFVWLLVSRYRYPVEAVHRALSVIFASVNVVVEMEETLKEAVHLAGRTGADISDAVIAAIGAHHDCRATVTFDRNAARRLPGMDLLA